MSGEKIGNMVRAKTDYVWLLAFYAVIIGCGEHFFPDRSSPTDTAGIRAVIDVFGFAGSTRPWAMWAVWWAITSVSMHSITWLMWFAMRWWNRAGTPTTHFWSQFRAISVNFLLLPMMQTLWDVLTVRGWTKNTMDRTDAATGLVDVLLWMLCFEITWYTQHRAMHDNKFLWSFGHAYHHGWRRPEHMIGITNFAFDHVVEVWVTMSSAFIGNLIFPINFYYSKAIGLGYLVLSVLVHWDCFKDVSAYHLNHHYLVIKNYGSHVPLFDIFFGTYQWPKKSDARTANKPIRARD